MHGGEPGQLAQALEGLRELGFAVLDRPQALRRLERERAADPVRREADLKQAAAARPPAGAQLLAGREALPDVPRRCDVSGARALEVDAGLAQQLA